MKRIIGIAALACSFTAPAHAHANLEAFAGAIAAQVYVEKHCPGWKADYAATVSLMSVLSIPSDYRRNQYFKYRVTAIYNAFEAGPDVCQKLIENYGPFAPRFPNLVVVR